MQNKRLLNDFEPVQLETGFPILFHHRLHHKEKLSYLHIPHYHQVLEFGFCHEGSGTFTIANRLFSFQSGDAVVILPSKPHMAANKQGVESVWTWIHLDIAGLLAPVYSAWEIMSAEPFNEMDFSNIIRTGENPEIGFYMERLIRESSNLRDISRDVIRSLVLLLLNALVNLKGNSQKEKAISPGRVMKIAPALQYMQKHYHEKISIPVLAKQCFMSNSYFMQYFRNVMNQSAYQFITEYRLRMAMTELRDKKEKVGTIAEKNGFPTLSCFLREFKKLTKTTPRKWASQN